jgi:hypothetical protein
LDSIIAQAVNFSKAITLKAESQMAKAENSEVFKI